LCVLCSFLFRRLTIRSAYSCPHAGCTRPLSVVCRSFFLPFGCVLSALPQDARFAGMCRRGCSFVPSFVLHSFRLVSLPSPLGQIPPEVFLKFEVRCASLFLVSLSLKLPSIDSLPFRNSIPVSPSSSWYGRPIAIMLRRRRPHERTCLFARLSFLGTVHKKKHEKGKNEKRQGIVKTESATNDATTFGFHTTTTVNDTIASLCVPPFLSRSSFRCSQSRLPPLSPLSKCPYSGIQALPPPSPPVTTLASARW
jgi:hypothetical protein